MPPSQVISLRGITKAFPGVVANDGVSLDLVGGQVHCLLGENGAGKSTLVDILAGLQQPDSGVIEFDGVPVALGSPRAAREHGVGVVHQHSSLVPAFTVLENLMLGDPGPRLDRRGALERLEELSELLGARVDPDALVAELGLGQQQQVEIIQAMRRGGRLLVLDEPTSMLTPQAVERLAVGIERVAEHGLTVLLITHKLREAFAMGDCVTVLRAGRVSGRLPAERLGSLSAREAQDEVLGAMFGGDPAAAVDDAAELAGAGGPVRAAGPVAGPSGPLRLELRGVTTRGRGGDVETDGVSLGIRAGEILGIAGIDGHGQRALAEAVAGQRPLALGAVLVDGEDVGARGVRERQRLGVRYVTDDRLHEGTVGTMPVAINLVLKRIGRRPFWRAGRIDRRAVDAEARRLIEEYDIRPASPSARAGTLSGGNLQKVLLARELGEGARIVVVNKPGHGLDLKTVRMVRRTLRDFATAGGSVLLLSTDLDELVELSHRIAVIADGRIVGETPGGGPGVAERVGQLMVGATEGLAR